MITFADVLFVGSAGLAALALNAMIDPAVARWRRWRAERAERPGPHCYVCGWIIDDPEYMREYDGEPRHVGACPLEGRE